MEAEIRSAIIDDQKKVAELVYMAGMSQAKISIFDLIFDVPKDQILSYLAALFSCGVRSWFHYSYCLVAEIAGDVAATACGYSSKDAGYMSFVGGLKMVTDWDGKAFGAFAARMASVSKVRPPDPPETWIIENVATFPEFRRQGLAVRLIEELLERGRGEGYQHSQISFLIGNEAAESAYEKIGFRFNCDRTDPDFEKIFGFSGIRTLAIDL